MASLVPPARLAGRSLRDFNASIVAFLVAMPLCMGIAIASGVPPEKGIITGIIGGIIVGALSGSPLQVSGPAAGLAVLVFEVVQERGLSALGPILILAGLIQLVAGVFRLGGWFRAISPAVVHGMLAGIGVLIAVGQFHVMFDQAPAASGVGNLVAIPGRVIGLAGDHPVPMAVLIAVLTIVAMVGWEKFRPRALRLVPGALAGVVVATLVAWGMGLPVARVDVPSSLWGAIDLPAGPWGAFMSTAIWVPAIAIAFIASAETLLSAAAVDRMHDGVRTDYNKELRAQGVGNFLCGMVGALPVTGVIVRSSANVQAGAVTRLSTILHGVWILALVTLMPWLLREIPMAALGAILVVTGVRLISLEHVRHLFRSHGPFPAVIWGATLVMVVATDLLTGVLVGLGLSLLEIVPYLRRPRLNMRHEEAEDQYHVCFTGVVSFVSLPRLAAALDELPLGKPLCLDFETVTKVDHTCAELIIDWAERQRAAGRTIEIRLTAERRAHYARLGREL